MVKMRTVLCLLFFVYARSLAECEIKVSSYNIVIRVDEQQKVGINLLCPNNVSEELQLDILVQNPDVVTVTPSNISLNSLNNSYTFYFKGTSSGHTEVLVALLNYNIKFKNLYLVVDVYKHVSINICSQIVGWIYIIFWGAAYYPQIYLNFKRKSVVGLNFDFVALNIVGYIFYGMFILGVFFVPQVQDEYYSRNPRSLIPVKINDVVYNIHGIFAILITIIQCYIYEKANQTISIFAKVTIGLLFSYCFIVTALAGFKVIEWLDSLYYCSYIKIFITALKYIPQAYMNYRRKSTRGWSIGLVLFELIGGVFSVLQMLLDSYNYNDWTTIFGNPTKFFIGLLNIVVPIFFIVQHYCLYRKPR